MPIRIDSEIIRSLSKAVETYNRYLQRQLGFISNFPYKENYKEKNSEGPGKKHVGHYPFIPTYDTNTLLRCLCEVRDYIRRRGGKGSRSPLSFLDCGCGVGNIMLLAGGIDGFGTIAGVEYDSATHKVAQELLSHRGDDDIIRGDLVNFKSYGDFDVIYYYEPIGCPQKRSIFYRKLMNGMRVGAIIIPNGGSYLFEEDKKRRFKQLPNTARRAYEKIKK